MKPDCRKAGGRRLIIFRCRYYVLNYSKSNNSLISYILKPKIYPLLFTNLPKRYNTLMVKKLTAFLLFLILFLSFAGGTFAQRPTITATATPAATESAEIIEEATPTPQPRPDITQKTEETVEPYVKLLNEQKLGAVFPFNFVKYAIRASVNAGVPPNTIVLLLLLPLVASIIATARHLVGIRGFGIFLPAALSVVFVATGPFVGIGLFLVIVLVSTSVRIFLRRTKVKLQYLPRMALLLLVVVLGILVVLFSAPLMGKSALTNVSIFPVLILVLLAEDFSRVQLGKSAKVAVSLTTETLILALVSYFFLTLESVQKFTLLNPELYIGIIFVWDVLMGRYVGLRLMEFWRFRKLIGK